MTRDSQKFAAMKKKKIIAGCCFLAVIFFITILKGGALFPAEPGIITEEPPLSSEAGENVKTEEAAEKARIVVDVAGAVSRPGILILEEGSRVYEALEQAGGVTSEGDLRDVNLAAELLDGEKLYVPSAKEYPEEGDPGPGQPAEPTIKNAGSAAEKNGAGGSNAAKKVNINTADEAELQRLSGVGPATARRILDYRSEKGRFKKIEDIMNVKGIGSKSFEKMKEMISVT